MTRTIIAGATVFLVFLVAAPSYLWADDLPAAEKAKIEALLRHIEGLDGAVFIRNGKEYDAKTAATFLRRKWESETGKVRTARDFVEKVASSSSTSGQPYQIRLKDGKAMKGGDYLLAELKKLEK